MPQAELPWQSHLRRCHIQRPRQQRCQLTSQSPKILWHSASKQLVYLSWYLVWLGRFEQMEVGMEKLGMQALIATLDEVRQHRIAVKSRLLLDSLIVRMLRQYLCGTKLQNSTHIVHEVQIRQRNEEMQLGWAIIDCGALSIIRVANLLKWLGISHEAVHITILGLNGAVMKHPNDSRKRGITVQYLDYLTLVDEWDVLVLPMRAYDLVLGLPWFHIRYPDINWARHQLTSPWSPRASGV